MGIIIPSVTISNYFLLHNIYSVSLILQCSNEDIKVRIMKDMLNSGFMVSFSVSSIHEKSTFKSGAVIDVGCEKNYDILKNMTSRKLFSIDREWLLLEIVNQTTSLQQTISTTEYEQINALPGSRVTLAQISMSDQQVAFYDMFRITMWTHMKYNLITRQKINVCNPIPQRKERWNFEGVTLRSGTAILFPEVFDGFWKIEPYQSDAYAKSLIHISYDAGIHLNFRQTVIVDNDYGYPDENGEISTGLMGRLKREEIDLGASGIIMRPDRIKLCDFTGDNINLRSPVIFKQPSLPTMTNIFVLPFSKSVWFSAAVLALITSLMLYFSYFIGFKLNRTPISSDISLKEVMTTIIACVCQQGPEPLLAAPSGRTILLIFELCILSLFVAYSAKIVALLQSSSKTIKTLSDLSNSPLTIGIQDVVYNRAFFKQEFNDKDIAEFYKKKIKPRGNELFMEPKVGLEKVKSGLFAYKCETSFTYKIISDTYDDNEKCGLSELDVFLLPMISLPVPKRSGIREHITRSVAHQREVGLLQRTVDTIFTKKPVCNSKGGFTKVSLIDFEPAIVTLYCGMILSFTIFCLEILCKFRNSILNFIKLRTLQPGSRNKWI